MYGRAVLCICKFVAPVWVHVPAPYSTCIDRCNYVSYMYVFRELKIKCWRPLVVAVYTHLGDQAPACWPHLLCKWQAAETARGQVYVSPQKLLKSSTQCIQQLRLHPRPTYMYMYTFQFSTVGLVHILSWVAMLHM